MSGKVMYRIDLSINLDTAKAKEEIEAKVNEFFASLAELDSALYVANSEITTE